jgi:hypothetical protein
MTLRGLLALSCVALPPFVAAPAHAVTYYVATDITKANVTVDQNSSPTWTFSLGTGTQFDLGGGNLTMKTNNADQNLVWTVYRDFVGGPVVGTRSFTPGDFAGLFPGNDTSAYTPIQLWFGSPIALGSATESTTYYLELSSTVVNSKQYFIKGGASALSFQNANGTPADLNVTATVVPEPASAAALLAGLLGLGIARRRNAQEPATIGG